MYFKNSARQSSHERYWRGYAFDKLSINITLSEIECVKGRTNSTLRNFIEILAGEGSLGGLARTNFIRRNFIEVFADKEEI